MGGIQEFLADCKKRGTASDNFLGLLNVLIGRRITKADGTVLSTGLTWRELALLLKKVRWEPTAVRQLGLDPHALPSRDRQRFWYTVIAQAGVDTEPAAQAGARLVQGLEQIGFRIAGGPRS